MATKEITVTTPYITFDLDTELTEEQFLTEVADRIDINLAIRFPIGPDNRGGYLFSFTKLTDNEFEFKTIEGEYIDKFNLDYLIKYVNHAAGLKFDRDMLDYCQKVINLKNDQ